MQRVGFVIKVKPHKLEEYKKLHNPIWPELEAALRKAGIRNYSLWLSPDGTEFGYLECDDWAAVCRYLDKCDVHTRWQQLMQNYLETPIDAGEGGQPVRMLERSLLME